MLDGNNPRREGLGFRGLGLLRPELPAVRGLGGFDPNPKKTNQAESLQDDSSLQQVLTKQGRLARPARFQLKFRVYSGLFTAQTLHPKPDSLNPNDPLSRNLKP